MREHIIMCLFAQLLFILVILFLYQFWMDRKERTYKEQNSMLILCASTCIVFSMASTVRISDDFIIDLRYIPLLIGTLYGGIYTAVPLIIVMLVYRLLIGGVGIISSTCISILIVIVGLVFSKRYLMWSIIKRVIWSMFLALLASLLAMMIFYILVIQHKLVLFDFSEIPIMYIFIMFIILNIIGMAIVTYAFEKINSMITIKQRIIQSEKIDLISHLAASISHEVRNPLTASRGFMQLLLGDISIEKKKEYVSIAMNELDRAEKIITDYLTFAKPLEDHQEIVDVQKECLYVIEVISPFAHMNAVEITSDCSPAYVQAGRQSFQQCLLNMMKNGIESIEHSGSLHIEIQSDDYHVTLLMTDTGKGMTQQQMKRLGEPYFTTKGSKGTGLGMMVVYSIIHSMNGSIEVQSEVGKGTCFQIRLPSVHHHDVFEAK